MNRIEFTNLVRHLMNYAKFCGIKYHLDYCKRSQEEQKRMVEKGVSKTMRSKHLTGKAVDIHVYDKNGIIKWDIPEYEQLGSFWKSLHRDCVWGGDWKFRDVCHFEVK